MPVPDYQSLMAPFLSALADGGDHSLAELRTVLAERLGLTEEDLQAKIPSGTPVKVRILGGLQEYGQLDLGDGDLASWRSSRGSIVHVFPTFRRAIGSSSAYCHHP